jgi:hypothetical protein
MVERGTLLVVSCWYVLTLVVVERRTPLVVFKGWVLVLVMIGRAALAVMLEGLRKTVLIGHMFLFDARQG